MVTSVQEVHHAESFLLVVFWGSRPSVVVNVHLAIPLGGGSPESEADPINVE